MNEKSFFFYLAHNYLVFSITNRQLANTSLMVTLTVTAAGDQRARYGRVFRHVRRLAVVLQSGHATLETVSGMYVFELTFVQFFRHATC